MERDYVVFQTNGVGYSRLDALTLERYNELSDDVRNEFRFVEHVRASSYYEAIRIYVEVL
jgi:hypothetical protein